MWGFSFILSWVFASFRFELLYCRMKDEEAERRGREVGRKKKNNKN